MAVLIIIIIADLVMLYFVLRVGLQEDEHPISVTSPSIQALQARVATEAPGAPESQKAEAESTDAEGA